MKFKLNRAGFPITNNEISMINDNWGKIENSFSTIEELLTNQPEKKADEDVLNLTMDTMSDLSTEVNEIKMKLAEIGKSTTDFSNWTDLSTYLRDNRLINPNPAHDKGKVKIILPPGNFYVTDINVLSNFTKRTSGFMFSGSGRDITTINFLPSQMNQYLFKNNDAVLQIHFEDITFVGNLSLNTNFMLSTSYGGAQNYTFNRCNFKDFNKVIDLQGANNNSEFTFNHCGFYGTIKDGVLFVGDVGTSSASDQFLNYNFFACQFEVEAGNFINMKYGGNINVYGGSFIHIEYDNSNPKGGTFFNLRTNSHSYGVCRLLVVGTRFELRNRNSKLINCEWENGNIEFLNCDMDSYSQNPNSVNWETAKFLGQNSFPSIKFDNCSLLGKHHYRYNTEGAKYFNSIVYESCSHSLLSSIEDMYVYSTNPETNFYNYGARPVIKTRDFKVNASKAAIFDANLNGEIHGRAILDKKILSIKNSQGSLPNRNGVEVVKLPPNAIITKVMLYCPSNVVTSGYNTKFTLSTNETVPTILADTSPLNSKYSDGFNVQNNLWLVCDTDEKRTLILKDNNNVDQITDKGLCLIEYIQ